MKRDGPSIVDQVRKAREVVNGWPEWKRQAADRQLNEARAEPDDNTNGITKVAEDKDRANTRMHLN